MQRARLSRGKRCAPGDAAAFGNRHDLAAGKGFEDLGSPTGPPDFQPIEARRAPQSQVNPGVALAEVAGSRLDLPDLRPAGNRGAHARTNAVSIALATDQADAHRAGAVPSFVAEQGCRLA